MAAIATMSSSSSLALADDVISETVRQRRRPPRLSLLSTTTSVICSKMAANRASLPSPAISSSLSTSEFGCVIEVHQAPKSSRARRNRSWSRSHVTVRCRTACVRHWSRSGRRPLIAVATFVSNVDPSASPRTGQRDREHDVGNVAAVQVTTPLAC